MIVKKSCIYPPKGTDRPLHIWLPDNYYETDERYPVMYFFDGHNLFSNEDATYGKSWGMKEFLEGWSKNMIIVGIECSHDGIERLYEYVPYAADWIQDSATKKLGEETFQWIIHDIKPMIDKEYRTYPFRECTAIGGSSMGGIMALYGIIKHNIWFSKGACISGAIHACMDDLMHDLWTLPINPDTRAYLSWGTREAGCEDHTAEDRSSHSYHCNRAVAEALRERGARARLRCQVGGGHCEADWEKLVPEFMNFLWLDQ